ncbi:MAG: beta-galactosidase trimerization domain-containing protein [Candidatus Hydrogenedentes bacterium]|nr:beta-galactosidase trimerization domain-containing protein [Candidatus Hydrogenedentota bacterium]
MAGNLRRLLGLLLLAAYPVFAEGVERAPETTTPVLTRPIVHDPWGKPLVRGPIRTLILGPRRAVGDLVTLDQQLDLDYNSVLFGDSGDVGQVPVSSADVSSERISKLIEREYNLIIAGGFDSSLLSDETWKQIEDKVAQGTGLVLVHYHEGPSLALRNFFSQLSQPQAVPFITTGIGEPVMPEGEMGLDFVKAYTYQQGRVVSLDYPGERPRSHFLLPAFAKPLLADSELLPTYFSLVCRAARWAADREPEIRIQSIEESGAPKPEELEIPPELPPAYVQVMRDAAVQLPFHTFTVRLSAASEERYRVKARVRELGRDREMTYSPIAPLSKGSDSYPLTVWAGPGRYLLDVWLLDKERVVDWHTSVIQIQGWPQFSDLQFKKRLLLAHDSLEISLNVSPTLHESRPCSIYARAVDSWGRLVAETMREVASEAGAVEFTLNLSDLLAPRVKVEVFAVDHVKFGLNPTKGSYSEAELQSAFCGYAYFPVRMPLKRDAPSFCVCTESGAEYNVRDELRAFQRLGVDTVCTRGSDAAGFFVIENGLRAIPVLTEYRPERVVNGNVREPCLSAPSFRETEMKKLQGEASALWGAGSTLYSLGDANTLTDSEENVCQSPSCLAGFRSYLEKTYGSLAALNSSWRSSYSTWDAVLPLTFEAARETGNFPPWVDFRTYMDGAFTDVHLFASEVVHSVDAPAQVGFSSTAPSSPYRGYDWWQLASQLELLAVPCEEVAVEQLRSFSSPTSFTGIRCAAPSGDAALEQARWIPWFAVFHGMDSVWCEDDGYLLQASWSDDSSNYDVQPGFAELARQLEVLKSGPGELLRLAERKKADIAIYTSQPSFYVNCLDASFGAGSEDAERDWTRILKQLGYAFDFVAPETVRAGRLKEYKALALPLTRALSNDEVDAIRAFAQAGGHLIADVAPGQFDEHGAPRSAPALDDLFGIERTGAVTAGTPTEAHITVSSEETSKEFALSGVLADTSVKAAGANPAGTANGTPIWISYHDRDRCALLVNHALASSDIAENANEPICQGVVGEFLKTCGIDPIVDVARGKDSVLEGEQFRFQFGKGEIIGVVVDPDAEARTQKLTVRLPKEQYTFDLLQGMPVHGSRVTLRLARGEAALIGTLPYQIENLLCVVPKIIEAGKRLSIHVAIRARESLPGDHVVHVKLLGPTGQSLRHYEHNLLCKNGEGDTYLPLALNERPGFYKVRAREVITGMMSEMPVRVVEKSAQ